MTFLEQILWFEAICYWSRLAYRCVIFVACVKFIFWGGW